MLRAAGSITTEQRQALGLVILDFDDTLIDTIPLYDRAHERAIEILKTSFRLVLSDGIAQSPLLDQFGPLIGARYCEIFSAIDKTHVSHLGFNRYRTRMSAHRALQILTTELTSHTGGLQVSDTIDAGNVHTDTKLREYAALRFDIVGRGGGRIHLDPEAVRAVAEAESGFVHEVAPLLEGVVEALTKLQPYVRLVVLTKGDTHLQLKRLVEAGIADHLDGIFIDGDKSPKTFEGLMTAHGTPPSRTFSVGNSFGSDIAPAQKVGIIGIEIDGKTWAYEAEKSARARETNQPDYKIASMSQLASIVFAELGITPTAEPLINLTDPADAIRLVPTEPSCAPPIKLPQIDSGNVEATGIDAVGIDAVGL